MAQLVTLEAVKSCREQLGTPGQEIWRTFFLTPPQDTRSPQAFLIEYASGRVLRTHFHDVDEFQVVVAGSGQLGPHALAPGAVHFARAYTGYGPVAAGPEGLSFLTLRVQRDSAGPQLLPDKREALLAVVGRQPWQATGVATFANAGSDAPLCVQALATLCDAQGLAAYAVSAQPGVSGAMPAAQGSGGQYLAVLDGSAWIGGLEYAAITVGFVEADEPALLFTASSQGFNAIVVNFPRSAHSPTAVHKPEFTRP